MELRLKKEDFEYYEAVSETPFSFETTQEAIVPDYCADVARIVDTTGCVLIHNKELTPDGRIEVNGVIKATVLFVPEAGHEVCALHLSVPFHNYCDGRDLSECSRYSVRGGLRSIDSRLLNPRKLLTRAELTLEVCAYRPKTVALCTAAEEGEEGLQVLEDSAETTVITDVMEREFTYIEELTLSASRRGVQEILDARTAVYPSESKIVGNKLVLKGIVRGEILFKDEAGELGSLSQEYLFSQIVETTASEDSGFAKAVYDLTGYEYQIGSENSSDDTHTVTMSLHIRTYIEVMETKQLQFLSDMYSTRKELTLERDTLSLTENVRSFTRKQSMREVLETAVAVKQVVYTVVNCGACACQAGESGTMAEAPVTVKCLYLDENDTLLLAERELNIKGEMEVGEGENPKIRLQCPGELTAAPSPEGIEVRFPLEFWISTGSQTQKPCVASGSVEDLPAGGERSASLVLRKFDKGTKLWDIAKMYRTTGADILAANQLTSEGEISSDKLLLIPRHK